MSEISELLEDAADLLEKNGWTQWELQKVGTHCLAGALLAAAGVNDDVMDDLAVREWPREVIQAIAAMHVAVYDDLDSSDYLHIEGLSTLVGNVTSWNDHVASKQEVLDKLRAAAKDVRVQEEQS